MANFTVKYTSIKLIKKMNKKPTKLMVEEILILTIIIIKSLQWV